MEKVGQDRIGVEVFVISWVESCGRGPGFVFDLNVVVDWFNLLAKALIL